MLANDDEEVLEPELVVDVPESAEVLLEPELVVDAPRGGAERRACPFCGEQIVATAAKCRFCHEVLDAVRLGISEPKDVVIFRKNMGGLGGLWIILAIFAGLGGAGGLSSNLDGNPIQTAIAGSMVAMSILLVVTGIGCFSKQTWAVWLSLVLTYLSLAGCLLVMLGPADTPDIRTNRLMFGGVGAIIVVLILVQAHRTLSISRKLNAAFLALRDKS